MVKKHQLVNLGLVMGSTLVSLLIVEIFLRIYSPQIGWGQRKDAVLGWANDEYKQFDPRAYENNKAQHRILFLGDSFLAGSGVSSLSERFPELLQERYGERAEVKVLATGGWGTDQQLLAFRQKGRFWNPHLVVVAFCANNDISNILSNGFKEGKLKPYFALNHQGQLILYNGYGQELDPDLIEPEYSSSGQMRSYLADLLVGKMRRLRSGSQYDDLKQVSDVDERYLLFDPPRENNGELYKKKEMLTWSPQLGVNHVSAYINGDYDLNRYQWKLLEHILVSLKNEVNKAGAKLKVVLLPVIFNPEDPDTVVGGNFEHTYKTPTGEFKFRSVEPLERLANIAERTGLTLIDPTADFISHVNKNNLWREVWPDTNDRHFSALGHRILANVLAKQLVLE